MTGPAAGGRDERIVRALASYFEARARGEPVDRGDWIARHPDLAEELTVAFNDESWARSPSDRSPAGPGPADGDYELIAEVGRGGMGVVFEARHRRLGRRVALKMLRDGGLATGPDVLRLRNEAATLARLDHPLIIPIYDVGERDGRPFYAMRWFEGGSLAEAAGRFCDDPVAAARMVVAIARAVHHAHQRGVLHRDLKPSNILLDAEGRPHVADFGLAKWLEGGPEGDPTASGIILGTPAYLAPEVASGTAGAPSTALDVYGLGAILYHLLTGRPPHRGPSTPATLELVRTRDPVPPRGLNPRVETDLETICRKALEKDPARRYGSAEALADDLERFLSGRPIEARPVGPAERLAKWARRHPRRAGLAASALGLALAAVAAVACGFAASERARREMEASLYAHRIALADRDLGTGDWRRVEATLDQCPPRLRGWEWGHLRRGRPGRALEAGQPCWSVAVAPDGREVAVGLEDGRILLWRVGESTPRALAGHRRHVTGLDYARDGRLASCSWDGSARVWDPASGRTLAETASTGRVAWRLAFAPDGRSIATAASDGLRTWDAATGRRLLAFEGHTDRVLDVAFSPDGSRLASASEDGTIRIWDPGSGRQRLRLDEGVLRAMSAVAFSPDGRSVAGASVVGTVRVWDAATGRERLQFRTAAEQQVEALAFSPDGRRLAIGGRGWGPAAGLWDVEAGRELLALRGHGLDIRGIAFGPGGRLATASRDGTARLWESAGPDGPSPDDPIVIRGHADIVEALAFAPDGRLATAGHDRAVRIWDPTSGAPRASFRGAAGALTCLAIAPDGWAFAAAGWDRAVSLWDAEGDGRAPRLTLGGGHIQAVSALAFHPDGRTIASGGRDRRVCLWDARDGRLLRSFEGAPGFVFGLEFSPDGDRLAVASGNQGACLRIFDPSTGALVGEFASGQLNFTSVAFSPDGRTLAVAARGGTVHRVDPADGREFGRFEVGNDVLTLAYHPDGRHLAAAGYDVITVVDADEGGVALRLDCPAGPVRRIAFDPGGRRLAATGPDCSARVWDLAGRLAPPDGR